MKFYNRTKELKLFSEVIELSNTIGGQFTVLSGRRRVGKSELLREAFKNEKHLYFFVSKKRAAAP